MCEVAHLLRQSDLNTIIPLLRETGTSDSVNWNQFPRFPVEDPDHLGLVKIRLNNKELGTGLLHYIFAEQLRGSLHYTDVIIHCQGGFVPSHRFILSNFSHLFEELIRENIKEIGIPCQENPVHIFLPDFKLEDVKMALLVFYRGDSNFPEECLRSVNSIIDFFRPKDPDKVTSGIYNPVTKKEKMESKLKLAHFENADSEEDSDGSDLFAPVETTSNATEPLKRTEEWVDHQVQELNQKNKKKKGEGSEATGSVIIPPDNNVPEDEVSKPVIRRSGRRRNNKGDPKTTPPEPIASTSKNIPEEPAKPCKRYEHDDEYALPGNVEIPKSDAEDDHLETEDEEEINNAGNITTRSSKKINLPRPQEQVGAPRYPERKRKKVERYTPDKSKNEEKCFFCQKNFNNVETLAKHSMEECGKHLRKQYTYPEMKCLICDQPMNDSDHHTFIAHVQQCYMDRGAAEPRVIDAPASLPITSAVPVPKPFIVLEILNDNLIAQLMTRPRERALVKGFRYFKRIKKEVLELESENDEENTTEQDDSRSQVNPGPSSATPTVIFPPSSQDHKQKHLTLNAFNLNCSCNTVHRKIKIAIKCLLGRDLQKCWFCFEELVVGERALKRHFYQKHINKNLDKFVFKDFQEFLEMFKKTAASFLKDQKRESEEDGSEKRKRTLLPEAESESKRPKTETGVEEISTSTASRIVETISRSSTSTAATVITESPKAQNDPPQPVPVPTSLLGVEGDSVLQLSPVTAPKTPTPPQQFQFTPSVNTLINTALRNVTPVIVPTSVIQVAPRFVVRPSAAPAQIPQQQQQRFIFNHVPVSNYNNYTGNMLINQMDRNEQQNNHNQQQQQYNSQPSNALVPVTQPQMSPQYSQLQFNPGNNIPPNTQQQQQLQPPGQLISWNGKFYRMFTRPSYEPPVAGTVATLRSEYVESFVTHQNANTQQHQQQQQYSYNNPTTDLEPYYHQPLNILQQSNVQINLQNQNNQQMQQIPYNSPTANSQLPIAASSSYSNNNNVMPLPIEDAPWDQSQMQVPPLVCQKCKKLFKSSHLWENHFCT